MPLTMPWVTRTMKRRGLETGGRGVGTDAWPSGHLALIVLFFLRSDAVVAQVLDELGLSLTDELSSECPDPGPGPARSSATAQTLPLPALLLSAGALFLTPLLCRPPVHRMLPQCGCQWEESRGCRLRPSRCRCRPGGAAQEPSKGLTAPPAPCQPREPAEGPAFSLYLLQ